MLGNNEEEIDACLDLIKAKELAQATLAEAEKKRRSQAIGEVIIEQASDDEFNEEHERLIQELEVSDSIEEEVGNVEVVNLGLVGAVKNKPK